MNNNSKKRDRDSLDTSSSNSSDTNTSDSISISPERKPGKHIQLIEEDNVNIINTENKLSNILKKLDYTDLKSVQTMLNMTLKKLSDKEKELLQCQKRCLAYEKVIETLSEEIKMLKTFDKN